MANDTFDMVRNAPRPADLAEMYARHTTGDWDRAVKASDVLKHCYSPFSLWADMHADPAEKDPPDPMLDAMAETGNVYEAKTVEESYGTPQKIPYLTFRDGFMQGLDAMAAGTKMISNPPIISLPNGMFGMPDVLERRRGKSEFGNHYYVIKEIKSVQLKRGHVLQAAFYNRLLGAIQGVIPDVFYVVDGDKKEHRLSYDQWTGSLEFSLERIMEIMDGKVPDPVYGKEAHPWLRYGNKLAIKRGSLSLISGVGKHRASMLQDAGFNTIHDVRAAGERRLADAGFGMKLSRSMITHVSALVTKKARKKAGWGTNVRRGKTDVFLDFESDGSSARPRYYLLGSTIRRGGSAKYVPILDRHRRRRNEKRLLAEFLRIMDGLDDAVVYHWGNFDSAAMNTLASRHRIRVPGTISLVNLLTVTKQAVAFPVPDYRLSTLAGWLGFRPTSSIRHWMDAYNLYRDWVRGGERGRVPADVLGYNRDDCMALMTVFDWLAEHGAIGAQHA